MVKLPYNLIIFPLTKPQVTNQQQQQKKHLNFWTELNEWMDVKFFCLVGQLSKSTNSNEKHVKGAKSGFDVLTIHNKRAKKAKKAYIDRVWLKHLLKTLSKTTLRFYTTPPQQSEWQL